MRTRLVPILVLAALLPAERAHAIDPVESFRYLVTGNGHGFQVFDVNANAVKQYLERPYRYLRASSTNPDGEGVVRRNLAFDTYFGVKVGTTSAWLGGRSGAEVGYVDQTNVIHSGLAIGGVQTESYFVSPFGYEGNAMVMLLAVTNTSSSAKTVTAYSIHNFKMGSAPNPDEPGADGESIQYDGTSAAETGPGGGAMVYAPIGGADVSSCAPDVYTTIAGGGTVTPTPSCSGTDRANAFVKSLGSIAPGETRWWGVAVLFDATGASAARTAWAAWLAGRDAAQVYDDVLTEWTAWRTPPVPGLSGDETKVWRQAETVLRMGQVREAYDSQRHNHGMVLASLPPGGWHTGWVRDATYAIAALARTGHFAEAKAALDFFLDADAGKYSSYLGGVDYRISTVRYFGDGEEEADYSGSPTRNIEIDGWGLFLWAARTYIDASGDVAWLDETTAKGDTVYAAIHDGVAEALASNLETNGMAIADASIWEVHWGNRQHFAYTTAATARGFCDMATIARRGGHDGEIARWAGLSADATAALQNDFVDSNHVLAGSLERLAQGNYRDGATVEALTWSLIGAGDVTGQATLGAMSYLQTPAGGYKRVEGSAEQYDTDEWILIDLRASDAFRRAGNAPKADQLLDWVTAQASVNHDLLPELYNTRSSSGAIGAYSGSIPMVGYGAGAYQLTLLDRAGWTEYADCGEQDLDDYPDAGVPTGRDGGSDNPEDDLGRTGLACVCNTSRTRVGGGELALLLLTIVVLRRRPPQRVSERGRSVQAASAVLAAGRRSTRAARPEGDGP